MPGGSLLLSHYLFTKILRSRYYKHFTDMETKAQRRFVTSLVYVLSNGRAGILARKTTTTNA